MLQKYLRKDVTENWVEPDISAICDKNKISERGCTGAFDWMIEDPAEPR